MTATRMESTQPRQVGPRRPSAEGESPDATVPVDSFNPVGPSIPVSSLFLPFLFFPAAWCRRTARLVPRREIRLSIKYFQIVTIRKQNKGAGSTGGNRRIFFNRPESIPLFPPNFPRCISENIPLDTFRRRYTLLCL
jgi:hypothetical protein